MERRRASRARRAVVLAGGAFALVFFMVAGYAAWTYASVSNRIAPSGEELAPIKSALDAPLQQPEAGNAVEPPLYVLLLGNDRRPGQGWGRSDSIILARLDPSTGNISLLSFPRDTRAAIPGHGTTKLNHAAAYGGPALMIRTVRDLTGLPVNHYVQVDFEGFASMVDAVGGVKVNVDRGAVSPEGVRIYAGKQTLNGKEALTFARNRKGYGDGDFARIRNQQTVLLALGKKMAQPSNVTRIPRILDSISRHMQTDMSVARILELAGQYRTINKETVKSKTAPGRPGRMNGGSYVLLDEEKFRETLDDFEDGGFGDEEPSEKRVSPQVPRY